MSEKEDGSASSKSSWVRRNAVPFLAGVALTSVFFLIKQSLPPPAVTVPAAATFVRLDTTTQGNWKSAYGTSGLQIARNNSKFPPYVRISWPHDTALWGSGNEVRALERPSGADRIAAAWYAWDKLMLDLNLLDGKTHQIAIYCLDWDSDTREQTVEVLDGTGERVLDKRSVSGFHNGQYVVWKVAGHIKVRATHVAGANAVVSGIFLD